MVLAAHEHNIHVHVSVIGYEFSLQFQGDMESTFYFLNPEYEHLPLPTVKAIFAAEKQEQQMRREHHRNISSEQYRLANQMDQEIKKIDLSYRSYNGQPYDIAGYVPPNAAIATLYDKYKANKEFLARPVPLENCLGELRMPKFTLSSETDILRSKEFQDSPLYPMFMNGDSKVNEFIGTLVNFTNKTTIAMNEVGAEAYSETDMDCVTRGCSEPDPKNHINLNMKRRFWAEINHRHHSGVVTNYFTAKVVSP
jgi:hypothetical protein